MEFLIENNLDNPWVLAACLFLATFVLEEAAIVLAAGLAAAGQLNAGVAVAAVTSGVIVSDWALYALGAFAGRSRRIADWVPAEQLAQGRRLLARGALPAGLLARLIPWMLFPIFVASGFVGIGFRRFALTNGAIGMIYVIALFFGAVEFFQLLLEWMGNWGWLLGAALLLVLLWGGRRAASHYLSEPDPDDN